MRRFRITTKVGVILSKKLEGLKIKKLEGLEVTAD